MHAKEVDQMLYQRIISKIELFNEHLVKLVVSHQSGHLFLG
jgi:hypothetical protein